MAPRGSRTSKKRLPKGEHTSRDFSIRDSRELQTLVGEADEHLRTLEKLLHVRIGRQPDGLRIDGLDSDVQLAADLKSFHGADRSV